MSTVLIVDDDEAIRRTVKRHLEQAGYEIFEAENGADGIQKVRKKDPEVVLLDVMMPEMDGFETLKNLRKITERKRLHVIMLTAKNDIDSKLLGFETGANDYLTKPFHPKELLARVRAGVLAVMDSKVDTRKLMFDQRKLQIAKLRLLLITRDLKLGYMIQTMLEKIAEYEIFVAMNNQEAFEIIDDREVSLVILEEEGQLDQNEFILKRNYSETWQRIPLILIMDQISFAGIKLIKRHHIQHVIVKPVTENNFYDKFKKALKIKTEFSPDTIGMIRAIDFFEDFDLKSLMGLLEFGSLKRVVKGKVLVHENSLLRKFGLIVAGKVGVYRIDEEGHEKPVAYLSKSNIIGDFALFGQNLSKVRFVCEENTLLFVIPLLAIPFFDLRLKEKFFAQVIKDLSKKMEELVY